ncbi:FAS1 domain containing protein [Parasponia andersonii]|uniref:FAS1 domain containing protein n=1 Tax=Parasponia andersonii TaxID=3476 RepID=A0A2P5D6Y5_PARAD|nr:FAS1 domain containing protein [Parasponia andersonii]
MNMNRGLFLRNSIAFVWLVVLVCCLFVVLMSVLRLPEVTTRTRATGLSCTTKIRETSENESSFNIGKFGEMMIEMLPEDLAFTVFVPSERAFERDLRLRTNDSLVREKMSDDTYAIVSRVLGFSAVPRTLTSGDVPYGEAILYDSISGFVLYISKDVDGMVVVNRVRSERVDVKRKNIVVHVMDGVIMDAEFEESVQSDKDEEDN